jgi:hypothetical protein
MNVHILKRNKKMQVTITDKKITKETWTRNDFIFIRTEKDLKTKEPTLCFYNGNTWFCYPLNRYYIEIKTEET